MSDFTQFDAEVPVVTPPIPEKVYDKYWLEQLTITSGNYSTARLYAKFIPCRDLEDGTKEIKTDYNDTDVKVMTIDNIWELVNIPEFPIALESVFQALKKYGIDQGIFK